MIKNTANQVVTATLLSLLDGSPVTSGTTTVYVTGDAGSQASGTGTVAHKGNGQWSYVPTQAETNYGTATYLFSNAAAAIVERTFDIDLATWTKAVYDRLLAAVPAGPAAVIPSPPSATQTTAYAYCFDEHGALAEGVTVEVALRAASGTDLYSKVFATATSDDDGLATLTIPRGGSLDFAVRRGGAPNRWVPFRGVNAATLHLPGTIGGNP